MKKIVLVSLLAMTLPLIATAQSEDDLYYTPSKKSTVTESTTTPSAKRDVNITTDKVTVTNNAPTTVIVRDSKGNVRNVDEYNRRYNSEDYNYSTDNDTLYIDEKSDVDKDLDGQWTNKFDGTDDDYEYATRIIRFRNPRYAIPISSPLYWDIVYGIGMDTWDWNVYYDDFYAYAFPTFTNRLWWDWRYGPSWGWNSWYGYYDGWYSWGYPYYSYGWYGSPYYYDYAWGGHPGWGRTGWRGSSYDRYAGSRGYNNSFAQGRSINRSNVRGTDYMSSRNGRVAGSVSRFSQGYNGRSEVTRMGSVGSRSMGRVINSRDMGNSVRPNNYSGSRSMIDNIGSSRNMNSSRGTSGNVSTYSRGRATYGNGSSSMYSRPSSTRSSIYSSEGRTNRSEGTFRSSSQSRSFNTERSSGNYSFDRSTRSSGSFSSGSGFSSGSSRGGGGSVSSGGGSRGGGGRR